MRMNKNTNSVFRRDFLRGSLSAATLLGLSGVLQPAKAQGYRYNPEQRRPVEATLNDLELIGRANGYTDQMRDRYEHAIHHLREFADRLHEGGGFDKDKLDEAIGDVQHVIDHNRMNPGARHALIRDVRELRRLRQHFDDRYRYRG
jgi:hypothetical protein